MTYSVVGADPRRDEVGVAMQSKFLAVGALVPWAEGGVAPARRAAATAETTIAWWTCASTRMGWENLEQRWVGDDHLDPVGLEQLRSAS